MLAKWSSIGPWLSYLFIKIIENLHCRLLVALAKPFDPSISKVHGAEAERANPDRCRGGEQPVAAQGGLGRCNGRQNRHFYGIIMATTLRKQVSLTLIE